MVRQQSVDNNQHWEIRFPADQFWNRSHLDVNYVLSSGLLPGQGDLIRQATEAGLYIAASHSRTLFIDPPAFPGMAHGAPYPEIAGIVMEFVGAGVVGGAAYDALKVAVQRFVSSVDLDGKAEADSSTSPTDTAKQFVGRKWGLDPESLTVKSVRTAPDDSWAVVLRHSNTETEYKVECLDPAARSMVATRIDI